ncbi:MAG: hypothetical protein ABI839_01010 [Verrucomicrobiota bacterium]
MMTNNLAFRCTVQAGAILLIGHGVMGLLRPRWHSLAWSAGPQLLRAASEELAEHPTTARAVYVAELAAGIALACWRPADDE